MAYEKMERFKCRNCVYHYSVGYDRDRCRLLGRCDKKVMEE